MAAPNPREQRRLSDELLKNAKEYLAVYEKIGGQGKKNNEIVGKTTKAFNQLIKEAKELHQQEKLIGTERHNQVNTSKSQKLIGEALKTLDEAGLDGRKKEVKFMKMTLAGLKEQGISTGKTAIKQKTAADQLKDSSKTLANELTTMIQSIPGGGLFLKLWDPDGKKIQKKALKMITDGMGLSSKNAKKFGKDLTKGLLVAGAAAAGLGIIFSQIVQAGSQLGEETRKYQDSLGLSASDAKALVHQSRALAHETRNIGAMNEDIVAAVTAVADVYDRIPDAQSDQVRNTLRLNKLFGIAASEGALMQRMFEEMGQSSEEAFNTSILAANLAKAAKVPIGAVIKDIASNAAVVSTYFKGNTIELFKSAINAKMLGLSLGDVGKIANKIMDIESSLQSEMQAQVILGRDMNFDAERRLVFEGKMGEALEGVIGKMGSIDKFNKMSFIEKEAAAEAAGLEVSQIEKALQKKKIIGQLNSAELRQYKAAERALETQNEMTKEGLLRDQQRNMLTQQYGAYWEDVKLQIMEALAPVAEVLLPAIVSMARAFAWMFGWLAKYPSVMKAIIVVVVSLGIALMVAALAVSIMTAGVAAKAGMTAFLYAAGAAATIGTIAMVAGSSGGEKHAGGVITKTGDYTLQAGEVVQSRNDIMQAGAGGMGDLNGLRSDIQENNRILKEKNFSVRLDVDGKAIARSTNNINGDTLATAGGLDNTYGNTYKYSS